MGVKLARSGRIPLIVLVAVRSFAGCAYYNTFYNAERAFEKGERARQSREALQRTAPPATRRTSQQSSATRGAASGDEQPYRTAIEKSAKVLVYHPRSRYVDDALLLMAKSYYRLGEYAPSLRKCTELLTTFPQSPLAPEARYWEGMALWQLGRYEEATGVLSRIAADDGSRFQGDAAFALARLKRERGSSEEAIPLYRIAVRRSTEGEFRYRARIELAECLIETGAMLEAVEVYRDLSRLPQTTVERYENLLRIATTQRAMGNTEAALATLEPLIRDQRFTDQVPRTRLEIARTKEEAGEIEAAVLLYQKVLEDAERLSPQAAGQGASPGSVPAGGAAPTGIKTRETAEANFRLGRLQEQRFRNFANAAGHYALAAQSPDQDVALPAKRRIDDISFWAQLHATLADTTDSVSVSRKDRARYSLAEHHLLALDEPDSALFYFDAVAEQTSNPDLRRRAQYASGWIWREVKRDTARSDSIWQVLVADSSRTRTTMEIRRAIQSIQGRPEQEPGIDLYQQAEGRWFDSLLRCAPYPPDSVTKDSLSSAAWWAEWRACEKRECESAIEDFNRLLELHPRGNLATRARFILGWYAENVLEDTASAYRWYGAAREDSVFAPEVGRVADLLLKSRATGEAGRSEEAARAREAAAADTTAEVGTPVEPRTPRERAPEEPPRPEERSLERPERVERVPVPRREPRHHAE